MENFKVADERLTTADRLKQIMLERGIKQADIVRLCQPYANRYKTKIGRNDISQYISGKYVPGQNKLFVLAKALRVNEAWLMGCDVDRAPREDNDILDFDGSSINRILLKKIPMLTDVVREKFTAMTQDCGTFVEANENINADFCMTAKGDGMINARIFDGDVVFIRQQPAVENGEIAAVVVNNEVTLKRVYYYDNRIELRSENPTYPTLNYEGERLKDIQVIGKAIAFQSNIR